MATLGITTNGSASIIAYQHDFSTNIEPYFIVGGVPHYASLNNVFSFEPIPATRPSQYDSNILGAQCNLWTEYVPSFENFLYKLYPRMCALAELAWTPSSSKNYNSFTNRLVTHEQRLAQMGANYNHETIPQIGTWDPRSRPRPRLTVGTSLRM